MPESEPFTSDFVAIGDSYESLAKLLNLPKNVGTRILEGELQFANKALRYRVQKRGTPRPRDDAPGVLVGVDGSRTFGPNSPWRLDQIWVKNAVAGQVASVVFAGWVE